MIVISIETQFYNLFFFRHLNDNLNTFGINIIKQTIQLHWKYTENRGRKKKCFNRPWLVPKNSFIDTDYAHVQFSNSTRLMCACELVFIVCLIEWIKDECYAF